MKGLYTVLLLMMSNAFMTIAWYGHLKLRTMSRFEPAEPDLSLSLIL